MSNVSLSLPEDEELLKSAGGVALAHGQLELMLRMTIKTLAELEMREALDATRNSKNWELRDQIMRLFKSKNRNESYKVKLQAILGKCSRLSEQRNSMLHNAWAIDVDGSIVTKGPNHAWGPSPKSDDLKKLASEIQETVEELNDARLKGFIAEVCKPSSGA